jgi:cell division protein FtsI/penicillin-binding protein 2
VYEFGSIIKPLTVAAGIDAGVITPESTYEDTGRIVVDGARISNFDGKARGVVSMQEVLSQSLNTGVAHITLLLGTEKFREYFTQFGIAEETGIDLPNEASPIVSNLESPRKVEYVTASFGQGIAMTPIATARALAVLANNGALPAPHVGKEIVYTSGLSKTLGWGVPKQVIRPESAEAVTRMLVNVVDNALVGGVKKVPEMSIAAKTGTAQIPSPNGGYYDDRYLHSFFGYFPAYDPKFLIFIYTVEPHGAQYASHTLTDPFFDIVHFLVNYYNVPPDRPTTI